MWADENVRRQTKHIGAYIKKHDPQIQQFTGKEFGIDYFKFIENEDVILDSEIPSRVIISVSRLRPEIVMLQILKYKN